MKLHLFKILGVMGLILLSLCMTVLHQAMNDHHSNLLHRLNGYWILDDFYFLLTSLPFIFLFIMFTNYNKHSKNKVIKKTSSLASTVMFISGIYYLVLGLIIQIESIGFLKIGIYINEFLIRDVSIALNLLLLITLSSVIIVLLFFKKYSIFATVTGLIAFASYLITFSDLVFKLIHDYVIYPAFAMTHMFTISNLLFAVMLVLTEVKDSEK